MAKHTKKRRGQTESFVVCTQCGSRIRANTSCVNMWCDCCNLCVRGDYEWFEVKGDADRFIVIQEEYRKYIVPEHELW